MLWADVTRALAFRYGFSATGQLITQLALGLGGQAVIEKYELELDLDTGAATGGVVAFQQNLTHGSLAGLMQYLNLALKAGGFGGFMGLDPLGLDLDGDGVELTREDSSKVYFEFDTDGFGERCGWVKGDDALLARDLNSNGKIDNAGELFGNATTSGFTLLRTLDSNADNQITAADAGFSTLRLWRDLNQNGVTDAGELLTLAASGISKISLATRAADPAVVAGNPITAVSDFTRADGTTGKVAEAQLLVNDLATKYLDNCVYLHKGGWVVEMPWHSTVMHSRDSCSTCR